MILYSVYERSNLALTSDGIDLGACVTEDYDRAKAIEAAESYYADQAADDGEYGEGERDALLVIYNEEDDSEKVEEITLSWDCEQPIDPHKEWGTWHKGAGGVL